MSTTTEVPQSVFGAAKDRAAAKVLSGAAFLTAEDRDSMFRMGTPFWIVAAGMVSDSQYGERARFTIVLDPTHAPNGEFEEDNARLLDLGSSAFRAELITELNPILATHKLIGPLYLGKIKTANGQVAWDVVEAPSTDVVPF